MHVVHAICRICRFFKLEASVPFYFQDFGQASVLHVVFSIWELETLHLSICNAICSILELESSTLQVFDSCCWLLIVGFGLLFVGC